MYQKEYFVYILTNSSNSTLYIGITNHLEGRVAEHKSGKGSKFTQKYQLKKLIHFEVYDSATDAIDREKQLKGWNRFKKEQLINQQNPLW